MNLKLQEIVFPNDERYAQQWELFYRETRAIYDKTEKSIKMAPCSMFDYMSYFNAFSANKWKKYTNLQKVFLNLTIQGEFKINLVGYHLEVYNPIREVLRTEKFNLPSKTEIAIEFPDNNETMFAFEIETDSVCKLYAGAYIGGYDENDIRNVELSLATTTFKKDIFIKKNISLLKQEIFNIEDEIKEHLEVHVIDNGRTLSAAELESANITIHPNKNVGGSGGFARGMIESINSKRKITHVLLMDDDVLILPESIKRTYRLLKVLRPEFDKDFISGAMLCYEQMNFQHEDVGYVHSDGSYGPWKERQDYRETMDILRVVGEYVEKPYMYAGWWYCCIPMSCIKENGLPLPLFIRGDDVEFSLRNQAKFITLNGISVWHMGFTYKFNASMELYQVHRNSLIFQATTRVCQDVDFISRMKKLFRARVLSLDYNGAQLILDAIEDFMKGPDLIVEDSGERIMREKASLNENLQPLREFKDIDVDLGTVYENPPRRFAHTWIYRLTYNGHRFCLNHWLNNAPGIVAYDWFYAPEHNYLHKKLLAVNPHLKMASIRLHNKARYKVLMRDYKKIFAAYKKEHVKIEKAYWDARKKLTSIEFWKKYLEI